MSKLLIMNIPYGSYVKILSENFDLIVSGYSEIDNETINLHRLSQHSCRNQTYIRVERGFKDTQNPFGSDIVATSAKITDIEIIPPLEAFQKNIFHRFNIHDVPKTKQTIINVEGDSLLSTVARSVDLQKHLPGETCVLIQYTSNNDVEYFIPVYKTDYQFDVYLRFLLMLSGEKYLPNYLNL